ncbi:protein of unknown function (plasmid) [Cupriavidus taiwanensis]|nr:hypothetical protein CBM2597_P30007 [Cupriavidus taiwanensis]SOZ21252.1 hypothetical protein CBM2595_P90006 [Cupriavidus taiwanensis]SOZ96027.1 hypothetical protein CBM2621_P100006 [Cupriavidus taiwanensis]SPD37146.1 protein of unknown function [Cupriavidus taiwanensis]SPD37806.1 protein of unknown function [Cupriavidus taiwanensis]
MSITASVRAIRAIGWIRRGSVPARYSSSGPGTQRSNSLLEKLLRHSEVHPIDQPSSELRSMPMLGMEVVVFGLQSPGTVRVFFSLVAHDSD